MIKDLETNEVIEEYKLVDGDWYYDIIGTLLDNKVNKVRYSYKRTEDTNVSLEPYSTIFMYNYPYASFNNKKFSII